MQIIRFITIAIAAMGIVSTGIVHAQDKAKAKESVPVVKVLLDNDKVRVTESTFKPGDVSRADRKARTNYIVKGATMERTSKDGKKAVVERKTGTALWLEADSDVVKNIGKTTFVVVSVTQK